jgi:outer membrane murein-binding lipoprotein Lpp
MESMKRITLVAAIALAGAFGLAGCGEAVKEDKMASGQEAYDQAVAKAKAEVKKAKAVDGEWRDIGKFLKQADTAAKAGDMDKAMGLLSKVMFQAKMGQQQAAEQAGVGNPDYLN